MAYPTDVLATGELVTAAQINRWCMVLADTTLGAGATSIDFSSIPAHWTHLLLVVTGQNDSGSSQDLRLRFNNDTAANYDRQSVGAAAATANGGESFADAFAYIGALPDDTAGFVGSSVVWIPNYAATVMNKSALALTSRKEGTTTGLLNASYFATWWRSASAINRLTVSIGSGNIVAGSRASVYGMGRV